MEQTLDHIKGIWPQVVEEAKEYLSKAGEYRTIAYQHGAEVYDGIKKHGFIEEYSRRIEPTPTNLGLSACVVGLAFGVVFLIGQGLLKKQQPAPKKKTKKRLTKAQRANKSIQSILDFVETTYVPEIDQYIEEHQSLKPEDVEYKYNYFTEMLLKEIMKLDGVEVGDNEVLRTNRKKVIKFIQDHQKRLDKFKKEAGF